MEQNNDEKIAKMLMKLDRMMNDLMKLERRSDLSIKRMMKAQVRMEMAEAGEHIENWKAEFKARVAKLEAEFDAELVKSADEFDTRMKASMKFLLEQFKKNDRLAQKGEKLFKRLLQKEHFLNA